MHCLVGPENFEISTNRLKADYSASELRTHEKLAASVGVEPTLYRFGGECATVTLTSHENWCARWESNPQNLASKTNTYASSVTSANTLRFLALSQVIVNPT